MSRRAKIKIAINMAIVTSNLPIFSSLEKTMGIGPMNIMPPVFISVFSVGGNSVFPISWGKEKKKLRKERKMRRMPTMLNIPLP